jgi:hypothetical protein
VSAAGIRQWGRQLSDSGLGKWWRRRSGEREIARLARRGSADRLRELADRTEDESLKHLALGAWARSLFRDDEPKQAEAAFLQLRTSIKGSDDPDAAYMRLFCLCHLTLIRGSMFYDQAAGYAKQAERLKVRGAVRVILSLPELPQRPSSGPVATLSLEPALKGPGGLTAVRLPQGVGISSSD